VVNPNSPTRAAGDLRGRGLQRARRDGPTAIAGEHPLTLYLNKREIVTLMTLGTRPRRWSSAPANQPSSIRSTTSPPCKSTGKPIGPVTTLRKKQIDLDKKTSPPAAGKERCSATCGGIEQIDLKRHFSGGWNLSSCRQGAQARDHLQAGRAPCTAARYATTAGEILMFVEDVGRHNAVDAIAGFMWLQDIDGSDKVFYTTAGSPPRW